MRALLAVVGCLALIAAWRLARPEPAREHAVRESEPLAFDEPRADTLELDPVEPAESEREAVIAPADGERPSTPSPNQARALPGKISGIVLDPSGLPKRATLYFAWDDRGRPRRAHTSSGNDGRFELAFEDPEARGDVLALVYAHAFAPAALTGVEAGTRDLVLRLGWAEYFTLDVLDPQRRTVPCDQATFYWSLAGHRVQDYPGTAIEGSRMRCVRSPVPFYVTVQPPGHAGGWFGPFEPSQVGDRLEIVVESHPRVRGRVTHAGQPVAGASVSMARLREPTGEGSNGELQFGKVASTDAEGMFETHYRDPGRYELRAFVVPLGTGRLGPIELDGQTDRVGLEIEIDRAPGRIEGRVLFPNGHGPEEIWLSASTGHGDRPLRRDGSFLLPDLPAGPCRVTVLEGYGWADIDGEPGERWVQMTHGPSRAPGWLAYEHVYVVDVPAGGRAELVIDLAAPMECELAGTLRIDGREPRLRPATSGYFSDDPTARLLGSGDSFDAASDLDAEGTFLLGLREPGPRRLELELRLSGSKDEKWTVQDRVELRGGRGEWQHDIATGSLLLLPPDEEHPLWSDYPRALWQGPGELRIQVDYPELDEERGTRLFRRVPAGKIRLESGSGEKAVARECEVRAGQTTELRWAP